VEAPRRTEPLVLPFILTEAETARSSIPCATPGTTPTPARLVCISPGL